MRVWNIKKEKFIIYTLTCYLDVKVNYFRFKTIFLARLQYFNAIADFQKLYEGTWKDVKENIPGILLPNGNFIFYLDDYLERILVLTNNSGDVITSGIWIGKTESFMNASTWTKTTSFKINNFQGIQGRINLIFYPKFTKFRTCLSFSDTVGFSYICSYLLPVTSFFEIEWLVISNKLNKTNTCTQINCSYDQCVIIRG